MTRTRYVAGVAVLALAAVPFIGASPASAAAGQVAVTGPLQTGDTETIDFTDGDETGAYKVELWGAAKVATLATGSDITALADMSWTIPTGAATLVGEDFKIKVVPGTGATFTAFESAAFDIEKSNVNTIAGQGTTWAAGVTKTITWDNSGPTGDQVDIAIVSGAGKATVLAKKVDNDESASVTLPVSVAAATGYKVKITPTNKAAAAGESAAVEVQAVSAPTVALDDESVTRGAAIEATPTSTSGKVKLDLVLKSAPTKVIATLAKEAASGDDVAYTLPVKLAAGTYQVIATVVGSKPAVTGASADLVVSALPAPTIKSATTSVLAADVTQGQAVKIQFDAVVAGTYDVSVTTAGKTTKLVTKRAVAAGGTGSVTWFTSSKNAAGTDYKIKVSFSDDSTVSVESSAFEVVANTTVVGAT